MILPVLIFIIIGIYAHRTDKIMETEYCFKEDITGQLQAIPCDELYDSRTN